MNAPIKLSDITLCKWVDYENRYANAFNTGDAIADYIYKLIARYCHYTGNNQPLQDELADVIREQATADRILQVEEENINTSDSFIWMDSIWKCQPVLFHEEEMSKEQYDASVDIALIFSDIQDGNNEAMYKLCAAFLRKENEEYSPELIEDNSERVYKMRMLPLNMALCVKKYVLNQIDNYLKVVQNDIR